MKRDHYFSILHGVITNIYKGDDWITVGDKLNIETDESFVYLQDLEMHLVEGKSYYMFLRDRGDHWTNKLVEYTEILDTENYDYMMSLLEE